ncbi:MAG: hypothetical protein PHD81_00090 [Candidatus Nanoarchaeia archaeon]|nr:hypothetical protein [Candidatus Nanoarchaeia archaeon]MDD5587491.1 hypothetical protein [Candidatus Nanoarchaeia archaeon]
MTDRYRIKISEIEGVLLVETSVGSPVSKPYDATQEFPIRGIGYHEEDGGIIHSPIISKDFRVLYCGECGMRIPIPRTVKTFGDLEKYLFDQTTKKIIKPSS